MSSNKFWDLDDILMSDEIITCIADQDIYGVDFISKSNVNMDNVVIEGNSLDIPVWLIMVLRQMNLITVKSPKYLTDQFYRNLNTDHPEIINFKSKNNYFYDICAKLIPILDDEQKWPKCITHVMYQRYLKILKNSVDVQYEDEEITKKSCMREKNFYDKMVKLNRNMKFYIENYENNNRALDELIEAKKMKTKKKKIN